MNHAYAAVTIHLNMRNYLQEFQWYRAFLARN